MANLTIVREGVLRFLKWASIIVAFIFVVIILIKIAGGIKKILFPPGPPRPAALFGKLENPKFPESINKAKLTYTIGTLSGELPAFPFLVRINKIEDPPPNLLALKNFDERFDKLHFGSRKKISENYYRWENDEEVLREITMNITSGNFHITSSSLNDPTFKPTYPPNPEEALKVAVEFLDDLAILPEDLDEGKTKTTLLTIGAGGLIDSTSLSKAQLVKVEFFQRSANSLPIVYERGSSPMSLIVGGNNIPIVIGSNFSHHNILRASSTYPVKTATEALGDLKNGKAYIASFQGTKGEISIQNIYLAYYMTDKRSNYLMPVVVFEGNDGFIAYVSAVRDEWIKN
ncbi:MAG: hypothetical protein HYT09_03330 [Candidatus Levybacteria bacterium]|nr:hypothetical protein [Candidatus Levybacteria bacterium]